MAEYSYTGATQTITLTAGKYKLECYGAKGGNGSRKSKGGLGGYVSGYLTLTKNTTLYLNIGRAGNDDNTIRTSFNGGGQGGEYAKVTINRVTSPKVANAKNGAAGGGATDIRLNNNNLSSRVIVAGGGGGAGGYKNSDGYHGGLGITKNNIIQGSGTGVNTTLGTGSNGVTADFGGGGGGGGYYGGSSISNLQTIDGYSVGKGAYGGSNYLNQTLEYADTKSGVCYGHGHIKITNINKTYIIRSINCDVDPISYNQSNTEQYSIVTVPKVLKKDYMVYDFNKLVTDHNIVTEKIDQTHYKIIIPANANYDINIDAVFDFTKHVNSDIYKNVHEIITDINILEFLKD